MRSCKILSEREIDACPNVPTENPGSSHSNHDSDIDRVSGMDGNSVFGRPWFVVRFLRLPRVADWTHVHIRSRGRSRSIKGSIRAEGASVDRSAGRRRRPPTTKEEAEEQEREPANGACDDEDEEIPRDGPCSTGAGVGVGGGAAGS